MYNRINLVKNSDDTYDICLYYNSREDTEFGLDFLNSEKVKHNIANVRDYITKHAHNVKVNGVKILVNGVVIATMSFGSFMNVYGADSRYSMAYLYSGTTTQQISYIDRTNGALSTVSPTYFDINADGTLDLNPVSTTLVDHAHSQGMKVVPFLSNHWNQEAGINALLYRENLSTQIANAIEQYNLDGVNVDIENVTDVHRDEFTDFVAKLRAKIPANKEVSVAVAANPNGWTTGWHGLYDYAALGQKADYLMVMAYDESWQGSTAGPVASGNFVERSITYALSKTTADKIVIGMPFYGRIWSADNNFNGNGITLDRVSQFITAYNGTATYDTTKQSVVATFTVTAASPVNTLNGKILIPGTYTIWYENNQSIQYKMSLINSYNLKGAGAWALGQEPSTIWQNYSTWLNTTTTSAPIVTTRTGVITATSLNVRSGPGTSYSIISSLTKDTTVNIIDLNNGWYSIKIGTNAIGYVSASYVTETTVTPPATTPPPETTTTTPPDTAVVTTPETTTTTTTVTRTGITKDRLNVRSSPSMDAPIITTVANGTPVSILSTSIGWHTVRLENGQTGYVAVPYIRETTYGTTESEVEKETKQGYINATTLNVRSSPSMDAQIVTSVTNGTPVTILSTSIGWHTVKLANGQTGYVPVPYVREKGDTNEGIVNTAILNVRSSPTTKSKVITTLKRNSVVEILESTSGWKKVQLSNGQIGYVSSPLVAETAATTTTTPTVATQTEATKTAVVNTAVLNVRTSPSTRGKIITGIKRGTPVTVLSTSNGWSAIKLSNGQTGYVTSSLIKAPTTTTETNVAATKTGVVNTAILNVRSSATTKSRILTSLKRGTKLNILSTSNGWHTIRLSNGQTGYVSSSLVK